jgi:DHA2 family multidrug resistance protein
LLRNEGGSVGTSLAQTIHERRDQFHSLRLGECLDPFNAAMSSFIRQAQAVFHTDDPVASQQLAWQALESLREQQASALAYFDCFWIFAVSTFVLTFVVLLMNARLPKKVLTRQANDKGCTHFVATTSQWNHDQAAFHKFALPVDV